MFSQTAYSPADEFKLFKGAHFHARRLYAQDDRANLIRNIGVYPFRRLQIHIFGFNTKLKFWAWLHAMGAGRAMHAALLESAMYAIEWVGSDAFHPLDSALRSVPDPLPLDYPLPPFEAIRLQCAAASRSQVSKWRKVAARHRRALSRLSTSPSPVRVL